MGAILPFEMSRAAGGYMLLYGVTLLLHVVFMNYVLAGCGYMAVVGLCSKSGDGFRSPVMLILRDWMPFVLSAAITAGVAPLLFVQVLYKKEFYSASLLLGARFIIMLPALIVAFYLLYVMKSRRMSTLPRWLRAAIPGVIFACFLYTAWTWTENHVLSIHEGDWVNQYAAGAWSYRSGMILPRFLTWCFGSIPTLCVLLLWQVRPETCNNGDERKTQCRMLAALAYGGMALAALSAAWAYASLPESARRAVTAPDVWPFLWVLLAGVSLQIAGWCLVLVAGGDRLRGRILVSVGLPATIAGVVVLRESVRLALVGTSALDPMASLAGSAEGLWAFLFFFLLNAGLIGWCVRLARRARVTPAQ